MSKKTVRDIDLKDKKVLVRCDLNQRQTDKEKYHRQYKNSCSYSNNKIFIRK